MTQPPYDPTITENLQTSAALILNKPQEEWVPWVIFLLTELEGGLDAAEATELLQGVQSRVSGRLQSGSW